MPIVTFPMQGGMDVAPNSSMPADPPLPEALSLPKSSDGTAATTDNPELNGYENRGAVGFSGENEALLAGLRARLATELGIDTSKLTITVTDGAITLAGTLESAQQRAQVVSLATELAGPRSVVERLVVGCSTK